MSLSGQANNVNKTAALVACVLEASLFVPTLHAESKLTEDPWAPILRTTIAAVRLSPLLEPFLPPWTQALWWAEHLPRRLARITGCAEVVAAAFACFACPEVRWGVAISLDLWYLLSTPLNRGLPEVSIVILLLANVTLCFADTIIFILMLAAKSVDESPDTSARAQAPPLPLQTTPVKFGKPTGQDTTDGTDFFDPTCIICLSDFREGEDCIRLPCGHTFHPECIAEWLARSQRCPLRCSQGGDVDPGTARSGNSELLQVVSIHPEDPPANGR